MNWEGALFAQELSLSLSGECSRVFNYYFRLEGSIIQEVIERTREHFIEGVLNCLDCGKWKGSSPKTWIGLSNCLHIFILENFQQNCY